MREWQTILAHLSPEDIRWIIETGTLRTFQEGHTLIRTGRIIDALFIVLEGELSVQITGPDGTQELARLGSGEIVGELSFVDENPTSADVLVAQTSRVLVIDAQDLFEQLDTDAAFAVNFYRGICSLLAERIRNSLTLFSQTRPERAAPEATLDLRYKVTPDSNFQHLRSVVLGEET